MTFTGYTSMPSLSEYVLASQNEPKLEVFARQADGSSEHTTYRAGERAVLASVECEIEVDRVYEGLSDAEV